MTQKNNSLDRIPELDPEMVNQILTNVYSACETEPGDVPIESLISYSNYRQERHVFQKILLISALIIFIMLPFLFISPKYEITQVGNDGQPQYVIDVQSFIPVSVVSATMEDGSALSVYESDIHEYTIQPVRNGKIDVNVILANKQYIKKSVEVETLDTTSPRILKHVTKNNIVYIYVKDDHSGIDYNEVYALSPAGKTIMPVEFNEKKGYVAFKYPKETLNVYIPDKAGNILNLLVSV